MAALEEGKGREDSRRFTSLVGRVWHGNVRFFSHMVVDWLCRAGRVWQGHEGSGCSRGWQGREDSRRFASLVGRQGLA